MQNIEYKMDKHGGFFAADPELQLIEYAYPSSIHAKQAQKRPEAVAKAMLASSLPNHPGVRGHWLEDRWHRLYSEMQSL